MKIIGALLLILILACLGSGIYRLGYDAGQGAWEIGIRKQMEDALGYKIKWVDAAEFETEVSKQMEYISDQGIRDTNPFPGMP